MAQGKEHIKERTEGGYDITYCGKRIWNGGTDIDRDDLDAAVAAGTVEVCQECADAKARAEEG